MLWITSFVAVMALVSAGGPDVGDVRLSDGADATEGRVEVYYDNQWNTVCDDEWTLINSLVVCRQLGYNNVIDYTTNSFFGPGPGAVVMRQVKCQGDEEGLDECDFWTPGGTWAHNYCDHDEDVGVYCDAAADPVDFDEYDIRLADGSVPSEGRVEIKYAGHWGTVCDDWWETVEARTACRDAGFPGPAEALSQASFGEGTGEILLDDLFCTGFEDEVRECIHHGWNWHNCGHHEDAGVRCTPGDVRLTDQGADTTATGQGNLEVLGYDGAWWSVCSRGWGQVDAQVLCNQLGFTGPAQHVRGGFSPDNNDFYFTQVRCDGNEASILDCFSDYDVNNCSAGMQAGVVCSSGSPTK